MTTSAAVLLSPVAWQHYFVLLLLPLAVTLPRALRLPRVWSITLVAGWILMDVPQKELAVAILGQAPASPLASLTFVSIEFYGNVGFSDGKRSHGTPDRKLWPPVAWPVESASPA